MTDALERLRKAKAQADHDDITRTQYAAYVADRIDAGWTGEDVAEYREEVGRIMKSGTDDEKSAAREFWAIKDSKPTVGINDRIRADIQERKAA